METQSSKKGLIWILVLVILIIIATYFIVGRANTNSGLQGTEADLYTSNTAITDAIEVKDQLAGDRVIVSNLALNKAATIEVRRSEKDSPGELMGSKYFERGERPGIIELTKPTTIGDRYFVIISGTNPDDLRNGKIPYAAFEALKTLPDIKG